MYDFKKLMGIEEEAPVMLQQPAIDVPAPQQVQQLTPDQATAAGLLSPFAVPREANYQAPRIEIPQDDSEASKAKAVKEDAILAKLNNLDEQYKTGMKDADSRRTKSEIFAGIANALPGIVSGATAMNTKASVKPIQVDRIVSRDDTPKVEKKYKTDYENLLKQYKMLNDDSKGLSAKDKLYASIAQAQLDQGAARLNNNIITTDKNLGTRVGNAILADQKGNELSEKQIDSLAGYDDTLTSLSRIEEQKKNINTGPLADKRNKVASFLGVDDPEVTSLRSEVIDTLASKIKALSGTAANESEVKRLAVTLPGINDSDEVFERKLKDAATRIREARKIREDHYKSKQGKNTAGYNQPATEPKTKTIIKTERNKKTGQQRITYSDGTVEVK